MAFRYLVYRTDFGNTIVRESLSSSSTGGTESELFTDFIIPEIQPLYLWRVTGGTSVVPNTDQNIESWLDHTVPISPDDPITYNIFTGYTAQTQTDLDGKINVVTGATGNIGEFDVNGNLVDSGFAISGLTGGSTTDVYVSGMTYVGSTLTLQRTEGLPDLTVTINATGTTDGVVSGATLSGNSILVLSRTEGLPDVTVDLTGLLVNVEADIVSLSGDVVQNTTDIQIVSGATDQNATDIAYISGETASNDADIAYISGVTDTKQDALSAGEGINVAALAADTIQVDLSAFTAIGGLDITLTGATNAVINDLRTIAAGLEYGGDYGANFTVRSLVDKAYVDSVAAGLDLKESVVVATTTGETDIILGGGFSGVIDGVTLADGDRVLIKNQDSAQEENGIYIWSAGSSGFTRSVDFVDPNVSSGAFTFVETGATNGGSGWVLVTQDPITIGTTPLTFTQFSSTGSITAGNGIDITNGIVSVKGGDLNGDFLEWTGSIFNVTGLTSIVDFNIYTGATDTRISNIETDLATVSGQTDQNTSDIASLSGSSISNDVFTGYTATTDTRITNIENDVITISGDVQTNANDIAYISGVTDTKLDTSIFTGYTASTISNEIFLLHTGGTSLNSVLTVAIPWNSGITVGSAYSYTGTTIEILEDGEYELTYNIPFNQSVNNRDIGIGSNIIKNGLAVLDITSAAGWTSRSGAAGSVGLPTVNLSFLTGDKLVLGMFRTGQAGTAISSLYGSILIKKKNTLQ